MNKKRRCFVIMPFSKSNDKHTKEYWTRHFNEFLKPRIEQSGKLGARRSTALRGDILKEIISDLVQTPVVVADLTDHNPNVYWELGVRQSFMHGTITIAEEGTKLPFDLASKGTLFYPSSHLKDEEFEMNFQNALKDCLENPERPDSHVLDAISGRGTIYEIIQREETIRKLDALLFELRDLLSLHKHVKKLIEEGKFVTTHRFRSPAIELLVTTRYVDQDEDFYVSSREVLHLIYSYNSQLDMWEVKKGIFEKWFLERFDKNNKDIKDFIEIITTIREELSSKK